MITQQQLKDHLSYDPKTGIFTRVKNTARYKAGSILGTKHSTGYVVIRIEDKLYKAHRLAWLYVYGQFPELRIDHINRDGLDNRLSNLRLATSKENSENRSVGRNNKSGHPGVDWSKKLKKWRARITVNYKGIHLGYFLNIEDAINAYKESAACLHTHNPYAAKKLQR
jgi:hypothetical protein